MVELFTMIIFFSIVWVIAGTIIFLHGIQLFRNPKNSWYQKPDTPEKTIKDFNIVLLAIGLSMILFAIASLFIQPEAWLVFFLMDLSFILVLLGGFFMLKPGIIIIKDAYNPPTAPGKRQGLFLLISGLIFLVLSILVIYLVYFFL